MPEPSRSSIIMVLLLAACGVAIVLKLNPQSHKEANRTAPEANRTAPLRLAPPNSSEPASPAIASIETRDDAHEKVLPTTDSNGTLRWWPIPRDGTQPHFSLITPDGKLHPEASSLVSLTRSEKRRVQAEIADLLDSLQSLAQENTALDMLRQDGHAHAIRIAPFPEQGNRALWNFRRALESHLGLDRSRQLISAFRYYDLYGSAGRNEVLVQIEEHSSGDLMASYEEHAPENGRRLKSGTLHYSDFSKQFGPVLEWAPGHP